MDRLEEWRLFVAVASERSFAKAAKARGKSPQGATRAIAALERRLGTRLFHRTTRSVSLTSDGERTLEQARRALAEVDILERPAEAGRLRGVVSVTAPALFGQLHVLPIVTELLAAHPELDVRLVLLDRVVSLAEEGLDVGVRIGELPDSSLKARLVGHVRSMLVASPAYLERAGSPRTLDQLAKHDRISFMDARPSEPRGARLTTASGHAAIDAALAGVGIVRVLSYQVDARVRSGHLIPLLKSHDSPPIPVHLVGLPGPVSRAAQAFADLAYERLKAVLFRGA